MIRKIFEFLLRESVLIALLFITAMLAFGAGIVFGLSGFGWGS